ncbi:MAG TPA: MMPL family transporter [Solirubrobacteraceae bacterium]|nr:MMPL family transporter [Solirubrobacteraceae bacterium]
MMQRLTRTVLHHKRLVAVGWILLTLVGIVAAGPASSALDQRFSVPGREGWDASQEIQQLYGNGGETLPLVPVVELKQGQTVNSPGVRDQLRKLEETARQAVPDSRVAGFGSTGDRTFVSRDGRTTFVYVFPPRSDDPFGNNTDRQRALRDAMQGQTIAGAPVNLTGYDALYDSTGSGDDGPGVLLEAIIGGVGALIVLLFVFGSALAFVPLGMAISSVLVSFLLLWGLTALTEISPIVQFLVALIGLGVSIDYALLIVMRWREERERGVEGDEAVVNAMGTAGRAVVFSGTTVAIGLLALVVVPLPFLRSMGYGGLLIPLVATACAITLLPVILSSIGPRLDRRRWRRADNSNRFWQRWAEFVVRRRVPVALVACAILGVLLASATNLHLGNADPDTIAKAGAAKDGLHALDRSGIGKGAIAPVETLVPEGDAAKVAAAQARVDGVHGAAAPDAPDWRKDGKAVVVASPLHGDDAQAGRDAVQDLRDVAHATSTNARVGGSGPLNADFIDAVYGSFPLLIAVLSILTFVLLARAFRSLLLPLKAIVLNVLSIGAAWGIMEIVWQQGHGSEEIWGIAATGSISSWIPFIVFAFLYGLSMDYEVFILARVREEYDITKDTNEAVIYGLSRTGRLVTSAALILFLAFAALASGPETDVKVLATGLAAGILLDATVVRAMLVPALVSMFGKWNWWLPSSVARILRVRPSPEPLPEAA